LSDLDLKAATGEPAGNQAQYQRVNRKAGTSFELSSLRYDFNKL